MSTSEITRRHKMKMHLGHAVPPRQKRDATSDSCTTGFYQSPTAGQQVPAGTPFNIKWDTSCLTDTTAIDIYLYAPAAANPRIHLWQNVNYATGTYNATIQGGWWNSSTSAELQLTIVPHNQAIFLAEYPASPAFIGTYNPSNATASTSSQVAGGIENVNNFDHTKQLSKGKVAAAVLMPILVVLAIIGAFYIRMARARSREDRQKWKEDIDKRMSTISTDWKSTTAAGAQAAIRQSMAIGEGGVRASSFSFGAIRPVSTVAVEGGQAGIGAKGMMYQGSGIDMTTPQMSELRPGLRNPTSASGAPRASRVSFAADVRPSGETRRTVYSQYSRNSRATSRAFHNGYVPPLPECQDSEDSGAMSPTQTAGALTLSAEDIRARMSGQETTSRPSMDEVLPALTMMRTGGSDNDTILPSQPPMPSPPPAAHSVPPKSPMSPVIGLMPMQPMPANMMSPDDMLRAYAERRAVASPPPISPASPVANYNGNGMRVLYTSPADAGLTAVAYDDGRKSMATLASKYDDEDAYVGTAA
ncbi:hypothetical protein ABKN59_006416 [Abortiporus biennis]